MRYIYPDSEHWLHYLEPVEIAYVILFAYCTKNFREKTALIEVKRNRDAYVIDDETYGDNDYELHAIPDDASDYDNDYKYGLYIEFSFAVTHIEGDSGDWNHPPESGESNLDDITITDINFTIDGGDNYTSITSQTVQTQTDSFTYKDLNDLAEEASADLLEGVTNPYSRLKRTFPHKLDEKIKGILKDNEIKIQNASLGKKYGI
jgi:hypothetical protein